MLQFLQGALSAVGLPLIALVLAFVAYKRGYIGTGDINFLLLGLRKNADGKDEIFAVAVADHKLPAVVDNLFLRLLIRWSLWRRKSHILKLEDDTHTRVLNAFRTSFSVSANQDFAHHWASDIRADEHEFIFAIYHKDGRSLRQMRAVSIHIKLFMRLQVDKFKTIGIYHEIDSIEPVLREMMESPACCGRYSVFLPPPPL